MASVTQQNADRDHQPVPDDGQRPYLDLRRYAERDDGGHHRCSYESPE